MNKNMYKKGKNANKTIKHRKKRNYNHKNTQKKMVKNTEQMKGGAVCDDLVTINQSNLLDIFKYNIQVPKLVIPYIFNIVIDDSATGGPGLSPDATSSKTSDTISSSGTSNSSSISSNTSSSDSGKKSDTSSSTKGSRDSGKKSSSPAQKAFEAAEKPDFLKNLVFGQEPMDGDCFFHAVANQLNQILTFKDGKNPNFDQQTIRTTLAEHYTKNPDKIKDVGKAGALEIARDNFTDNTDEYTRLIGMPNKKGGIFATQFDIVSIQGDNALVTLTNGTVVYIDVYNVLKNELKYRISGDFENQAQLRKDGIQILLLFSGGNHYDRLYFNTADEYNTYADNIVLPKNKGILGIP